MGMAFIVLRRTRNTRSYYLVESYRDRDGRSRKRTLAYLGREQDGTDTLEKALAHWQSLSRRTARELRAASGPRRDALKARREVIVGRIALIEAHLEQEKAAEAEKHRCQQQAEAERRRRRERLAKHAFRFLAMRLHPDQGGTHEEFIRLKDAYERAEAAWRCAAAW